MGAYGSPELGPYQSEGWVRCRHCGTTVPASTLVCPNCGGRSFSPAKENNNRRKTAIGVGLCVLACVIVILYAVKGSEFNLSKLFTSQQPTQDSEYRIVFNKEMSLTKGIGRYSWTFQIYDLRSGKIITPAVSIETQVKNNAGATVFSRTFSVSSKDYTDGEEPSCTIFFFADDIKAGNSTQGTVSFKVSMSSNRWFECEVAIMGLPTAPDKAANGSVATKNNKETSAAQPTKSDTSTISQTTPVPTTEPVPQGKKNALTSAKNYLNYMPFSYDGLVRQLEFEGFTHEEAVYGADNCGADWMGQAISKSKQYIEMTAFSRNGLVQQLEYEGFSHEEAIYGTDNCGADWREQAGLKAKQYMELMSFSKDRLIQQLEYEGFTHEEALYGVETVGY